MSEQCYIARDAGASEAGGDNDDVGTENSNEHPARKTSSAPIPTEVITQIAEAVVQNQQAVATMSNALISSQRESSELLKELKKGRKNIVEF